MYRGIEEWRRGIEAGSGSETCVWKVRYSTGRLKTGRAVGREKRSEGGTGGDWWQEVCWPDMWRVKGPNDVVTMS